MLRILRSIYKANKYITFMIIFQMFIMIFLNIPTYNKFKTKYNRQKLLENSSISNSFIFMGKFPYKVKINREIKSNDEDLIADKKKIYEYYNNNKDIFKSITPKKKSFYDANNNGDVLGLEIFDKESINLLNKYTKDTINLRENFDKNQIPVIVQQKFSKRFIKDSIVKMNLGGEEVNFKVVGYYEGGNAPMLNLGIVATDEFAVSELLDDIDNINPIFVTLDRDELREFKVFNSIETGEITILYFSEKATNEDVKKLENYVKENSLGYYSLSKPLFEEQKEQNKIFIQNNLDLIASFLVINIFTLIAIGTVNKQIWERRFSIYYLNGMSKTNIYWISFLYYSLVIAAALLIYNIIVGFFNIDFIKYKFISQSEILSDYIIHGENVLHFNELIILVVFLVSVISIIAYLPLSNINKRYRRKLWD